MASDATVAILETADQTYGQIRNNTNLSADAKRTAIASAYLKAVDAVGVLKSASEAATVGRIQTLSRQLFGLPTTASSADMANLRDATERVNRFDQTSEALASLNQANLIGDTAMVRAVLGAAYANQWSEVIDAYLALHPTDQAAAQELWDLNLTASTHNNFSDFIQWIVPTPPEVAGLTDYKVRELATGATPTIQVFS
jgi:hypothetical protein